LETDLGFTLMGADVPSDQEYKPGNNIGVSVSGDDAEALRDYWARLSEGGTVVVPMERQLWGDEFGMCVDRFGVGWMVDIGGPQVWAEAPPAARGGARSSVTARPGPGFMGRGTSERRYLLVDLVVGLLDALADVLVDVAPVLEGAGEHRFDDTVGQVTGDRPDEPLTLGVVEDLTHQRARLREVVVLRVQLVGAAHQLAVGLPTVLHRSGLVGPATSVGVGGVDRCRTGVFVGHVTVEGVGVGRHLR